MSTPRKVVVIGANGRQGAATVRALLASDEKFQIVAMVRSEFKGKSFEGHQQVQVMIGDLDDIASLHKAFVGAYGVFFYFSNQFKMSKKAMKTRLQNATEAAKQAEISFFVVSCGIIARSNTGVGMIDELMEYHASTFKASTFRWCVLNPSGFMDDILTPGDPSSCETYDGVVKASANSIGWISCEDIGLTVTKAFKNPDNYAGKCIDLVADVMSGSELAALLCK